MPGKPVAGKPAFAKAGASHPAAAKAGGKASGGKPAGGKPTDKPPAAEARPGGRDERAWRKALGNTERTIARLDDEKRSVNSRLLSATDPDEAVRLHHELADLARQLAEAEDRWCQQQEELGGQ